MKKLLIIAAFNGLLALTAVQAQHINAGAFDSDSNGSLDKLYFVNGSGYVNTSGYIFTANYKTTGTYAGYYDFGPSFTALASLNHTATAGAGEIITASAAAVTGSFLKLQLVSVSGPATGTLSYWAVGATLPTFSLDAGAAAVGNEMWNLTDTSITWTDGTPSSTGPLGQPGQAGSDPYGHIHGQRFTADLPGTYTVGFQIVDAAATNLTTSDIFYVTVNAVPEPSTYALLLLGGLALFFIAKRRKGRVA